MDVNDIDWTWKVYRRADGTSDFIPAEEYTRYEIVREGLSMRDAMALSDEINNEARRDA